MRCCSDKAIAGWAKRTCNKKAMWTESDGKNFGGCQHAMGYVAARDFCAGLGARLCTRAEFKSGCTRGTGCGHDADLIWASTTGTKACHDVIKATNNARGLQRCAPHVLRLLAASSDLLAVAKILVGVLLGEACTEFVGRIVPFPA